MPPSAVQIAAKDIKDRERRGLLSATPERIAKSGEPLRTLDKDQAQELSDWPLERLYRAGALGQDKDTSKPRYDAGERLYKHWYYGRMFPLGSRDYREPYSGAGERPFSIRPTSERVLEHRQHWRAADARLGGDRIAVVTRAIVLEEREPTAVGMIISGRKDKAQARAVAIEFLLEGLDRLCVLWRMT